MSDNPLVKFDHTVALLTSSIRRGSSGLHSVPGLIKQIINENMWQRRVIEATGEVVECKSFNEFVVSTPPKGVGTDLKTLERLCFDDKEALTLLSEAVTEGPGKRAKAEAKEDIHNNIMNITPQAVQGTSRSYTLRKLRKDAPELHAKVIAGDISPNAAMIEAGFRRKMVSIPTDPTGAANAIIRNFNYDDLTTLINLLVEATQ